MSIFDLPPVFSRGLELGATEQNIRSGFRKNGTFPFDRQIFQDIDFMPSNTTDRPYTPASDIINEEDIPIGADVELAHNRSHQSIDASEFDDIDIDMEARTSTPVASSQDLINALENIRPFPKAPAHKQGGRRGRKPGKTAILTGEEAFNEVRSVKEAIDAKKKAVEERKAATAAKKAAAIAKKDAAKMKKMVAAATKALKGPAVPKRINQRRKTTSKQSYTEETSTEEEEKTILLQNYFINFSIFNFPNIFHAFLNIIFSFFKNKIQS